MILTNSTIDQLLAAECKALATSGPHGINVVPVSTIRIIGDKILLCNYFFNKTLDNIQVQPSVALVAWRGLTGTQIKATATHTNDGLQFEEMRQWVAEHLPQRVVKGVLILTPEEVFDVSPPV